MKLYYQLFYNTLIYSLPSFCQITFCRKFSCSKRLSFTVVPSATFISLLLPSFGCGRILIKTITWLACYFVPYRSYHLEYVLNRTPVLFAEVLICLASCLYIFSLVCFSFAVDNGGLFSRSLINRRPSSAASPLGLVLLNRMEVCDISNLRFSVVV